MMNGQHAQTGLLAVSLGFAANALGTGVAYAAIACSDEAATVVRVPFALTVRPALQSRDVAYAALNAVAEALLQRGCKHVELHLDDDRIVADLAERRTLPAPLTVPYVALRCRLNRFATAEVMVRKSRTCRDLTNRARAEALLQVAA